MEEGPRAGALDLPRKSDTSRHLVLNLLKGCVQVKGRQKDEEDPASPAASSSSTATPGDTDSEGWAEMEGADEALGS